MLIGVWVGLAALLFTNAWVILASGADSTEDVDEVPEAQTAIVLGALVEPDGRMSSMLEDRVARAHELWEVGKVERILVTGDHGDWIYDEPDTMRLALLDAGVPPRVIFTDHAGFDTWTSMVRAKKVFGVEDAVVVTQGFHMERALFLADQADLDATGLYADRRDYGREGILSATREVLGRVKAFSEGVTNRDVVLGPEIPISGDGRASWGRNPPEGTPPAGAPRG